MSDRNPLRALQDALEHFNARDDGRDEPGFFALAEARREMEALLAEKDAEIEEKASQANGLRARIEKLNGDVVKLLLALEDAAIFGLSSRTREDALGLVERLKKEHGIT